VPAVGTGIGIHEMMKTAAPTIATRILNFGSSADFFFTSRIPHHRNGAATRYHSAAHPGGSMPSEMCMAYAPEGNSMSIAVPSNRAKRVEDLFISFSFE
jgi:hypothetical protein